MDKNIKPVSFEEAEKIITEQNAVLLDVREESEFCVMHADGAQCLPVDSIDKTTAGIVIDSAQTPVIVYCKTGSRSSLAAQRLSALGYKNIYDLGSMVGWPYGMGYGAY